jgi:two-component system, OmpR family, response regulator
VGPHVLMADSDRELAEAVAWYLRAEGCRVTLADGAERARQVLAEDPPEVAVLDVAMAGADGFDLVELTRQQKLTSVLLLGESPAEVSKAAALGLADDYATKPLGPMALLARVRSLLRSSGALDRLPPRVPDLEVDPAEQSVLVKGQPAALTHLEFRLLLALMQQPGVGLSRSQLADAIWGDDYYGSLRLVDWHVARLRRKLRQAGLKRPPVATVRGTGYAFRPEA